MRHWGGQTDAFVRLVRGARERAGKVFFCLLFFSSKRKVRLVGQTLTAAGTATGENLSAVSSCHSLAEAMHLAALALLRLIRSEHSGCTSIIT